MSEPVIDRSVSDTRTIGELLTAKADLHDRRDELNSLLSEVNKGIAEADDAIIARLAETGTTKAANDRLSVSITKKWRATYDPEKWDAIVRSLVDAGYGHVIQRRMTDAKVLEMFDNGVALPDGLRLEAFDDLSHRRVNAPAK